MNTRRIKTIVAALVLSLASSIAFAGPLVDQQGYLGNFAPGDTVDVLFSTHAAIGTPTTLAGTPAIRVYKTGSDTQDDSGITLDETRDAVVGMASVVIDTSTDGTFYAAGADYQVVIETGTVDGVSVVGTVVATFSISNRVVNELTANTITATSIATDAITAAKIEAAAIGASELATDAIGAAEIASAAIAADEIATDAIGAAELAADAIGADEVAADAIGASEVAASAIGASEIATDAIGAAEIAANALMASEVGATALDTIATTAPAGVASTFREMMVATWRAHYKKVVKDSDEIKYYDDAGTGVIATKTFTSSGADETVNAAE